MLKPGKVTKVKVLFLVLVFVFNFDLFKFSAAILEKGLLHEYSESVSVLLNPRETTTSSNYWQVQEIVGVIDGEDSTVLLL